MQSSFGMLSDEGGTIRLQMQRGSEGQSAKRNGYFDSKVLIVEASNCDENEPRVSCRVSLCPLDEFEKAQASLHAACCVQVPADSNENQVPRSVGLAPGSSLWSPDKEAGPRLLRDGVLA